MLHINVFHSYTYFVISPSSASLEWIDPDGFLYVVMHMPVFSVSALYACWQVIPFKLSD